MFLAALFDWMTQKMLTFKFDQIVKAKLKTENTLAANNTPINMLKNGCAYESAALNNAP